MCVRAKSLQLSLSLCDRVDCSLPGSSVHGDSLGKNSAVGRHALLQGIFPTQEWNLRLLCLLHRQAGFFFFFFLTTSTTWEAQQTERDIASWPLVHSPLPSRRIPERSQVSLLKNAWEFPRLLSPEHSYATICPLPSTPPLPNICSSSLFIPLSSSNLHITYLTIMLIIICLS